MKLKRIFASLAVAGIACAGATAQAQLTTNWAIDAPATTASASVSTIALTSNVVTVTTAAAHGFEIGQRVLVALTPPNPVFDGEYAITTVPSATTFTYARTNANVASAGVTGTAAHCYFGTGDNNRSADYNAATSNVLLARNTPGISIIDGATGAYEGEVSMAVGGAIVDYSLTSNVGTINTTTAHGLSVGQWFRVVNVNPTLDGTYQVVSAPSATSVTFARTATNIGVTAGTGGHISPVAGGTVTLQKMRAASSNIYAANLIINANNTVGTSSDYLTIYRWDSESGSPSVIYRNNAAPNAAPAFNRGPQLPTLAAAGGNNPRYGDSLDVVANGNTSTDSVEIYMAVGYQGGTGPADKILKFTYTEGDAAVSAVSFIQLTGSSASNAAIPVGVAVEGFGGRLYRATSQDGAFYTNDGLTRTAAGTVLGPGGLSVTVVPRFLSLYGRTYLGIIDPSRAGSPLRPFTRAALVDIQGGGGNPRWAGFGSTAATTWINANNSGDIAPDDQGARPGRFYSLATNNRLASLTATDPGTAATKRWDGEAGDGLWFSANNWAPNGVPTAYDDVILDNTNVAGAYTVKVVGKETAIAKTLTVDGGGSNNAIQLHITAVGEGASAVAGIAGASTAGNSPGNLTVKPTITGTFVAPANNQASLNPEFRVEILSASTFRWNSNASTTVFGTTANFVSGGNTVAFTAGTPVALSNGYSVTFPTGATYAASLGQNWIFTPNAAGMCLAIHGDGTAADDLVFTNGGRLLNETASNSLNTNTIANWGTGNTSLFGPLSVYTHANNRSFTANFPSPSSTLDGKTTWNASSSVIYDVFGGTTPAFAGYTFGNYTLTNSFAFLAAPYNPSATTARVVQGDLTISGNTTSTISGTGAVTVGGTIVNNSTATAPQLVISAPLIADGAATTLSGTGTTNLTGSITVNAGKALTLPAALTVPSATVNGALTTNGVLSVTGNVAIGAAGSINGTGGLTTAAATTVFVGNPAGFVLGTSGTNTLNASTDFTFDGTAAQVTGASLPATVDTLTFNNPTSVTLSNSTTAGTLALTAGEVITGANTLTASGSVTRTAGYVNGNLARSVNGTVTGARDFAVGSGGSYAPVTVDITAAGTGTGTITVSTTAGVVSPATPEANKSLDRKWDITSAGISGTSSTLTFNYANADVPGTATESNFVAARYNGASWDRFLATSTPNAAANSLVVTGVGAYSPWTLFEANANMKDPMEITE